jgi:exportin-2 (importin alpha re-exporter)
LFPPFQAVLSLDVAEFSPYVFQILAQLLEFRADGVSQP